MIVCNSVEASDSWLEGLEIKLKSCVSDTKNCVIGNEKSNLRPVLTL